MSSNVMTPVAKPHVCRPQSEVDLEMKRIPALQRRKVNYTYPAEFYQKVCWTGNGRTHREDVSREANLVAMVAQSTPAMEEERSDLHTEEEKERVCRP